ncbi:MAG: Clp protease ClpP [Clostridia bacterium]|nr:Clp protease ClpP [Clostridia bacterium]
MNRRRKQNPMRPQTKFWNWKNQADGETEERVLELYGTIAEESWFDDDITPKMFRDELFAGSGDVVVWINSPGGDCVAASQIYSMLMDYKGKVTVKIDGIAASAASVIAMAGTEVLMAPTALIMIHNPLTVAFGDHGDLKQAIEMLDEVKESIINAYELRTGMSRAKLSRLMDEETWMNANKAIELGFADGVLTDAKTADVDVPAYAFSGRSAETALLNKVIARSKPVKTARTAVTITAPEPETKHGRSVTDLMERLSLLQN